MMRGKEEKRNSTWSCMRTVSVQMIMRNKIKTAKGRKWIECVFLKKVSEECLKEKRHNSLILGIKNKSGCFLP